MLNDESSRRRRQGETRFVFQELRDVAYFNRAYAEAGTVVWPNGQDICPDTLYEDSKRLISK